MIIAFVGRGGMGKTLSAVEHCWSAYRKGRAIASNTPLVDLRLRDSAAGRVPVDPELFGESWADTRVNELTDIYDLENCLCLLDELHAWLPSHKHQTIPDEVRRFIAQDRREGVDIVWTHRTTQVFIDFRENTTYISRVTRRGPFVKRMQFDPQDKAEKPFTTWRTINPRIYDLYQTMARVGDAKGEGGGLGSRPGYGPDGTLVALKEWGKHGEDIYIRKEHILPLVKKFGRKVLGYSCEREGPFERFRIIFDVGALRHVT